MSLYDLLQAKENNEDKMQGVVIGLVTNIQDPENMGRVKVTFPWNSSDESYWARVATLMAGKERGSFFLPEVGDEVLVAFEMGNVNHPYVIGSLWNGEDKPPETHNDGKNNIRKITTRSGHELIFNDEDGKGQVTIHTGAGHQIVLDDSAGSEKIQITDKSGANTITLDSVANQISIESSMQLKLKSQSIEIEADSMMTLKAGAVMTIQGAMVKIN